MARRPRGQLRQDILDTVIELLMNTGDVASVSIDAVVDLDESDAAGEVVFDEMTITAG